MRVCVRIGLRVGVMGGGKGGPVYIGSTTTHESLRFGALLLARTGQHRFACVGGKKAWGMEGRLRVAEYPGR